jgi:hypothetical protein
MAIQFGRISVYFQYPVSGKLNPASGRKPDIKKADYLAVYPLHP